MDWTENRKSNLTKCKVNTTIMAKGRPTHTMNADQLNHYKNKLAFETDSWDVYEALSRNDPVVVVDGRSAEAFAREHIPGAVNLPHREIDELTTATLDRSMLYVCYCGGSYRAHILL